MCSIRYALYRYDPWKVLRTYEPITVKQAVGATKFQGKEPVREGLVPQPYDSGESRTDQGISRQGNRRVRALLVEMAHEIQMVLFLSVVADHSVRRCAAVFHVV